MINRGVARLFSLKRRFKMVTIEQVEKGVASYLDTELMPKLADNPLQKVLVRTAISLGIRKSGNIIRGVSENQFVKMLEIFDDDCNIDIDILKEEVIKQIGPEGLSFEVPVVGKMTFHKEDIEKLYKHIVGGAK
jgi:hypothetical protein